MTLEHSLASTLTKIHKGDTMNKIGKVCTKCKVFKYYSEFDIRNDVYDSRRSHCKECIKDYRERTKETIKENGGKILER